MKLAPLADIIRAAETEPFGLEIKADEDLEHLRNQFYRARQVYGIGQSLSFTLVPIPAIFIVKSSTELPE